MKNEMIHVRANGRQKQALQRAAGLFHENLSEFMMKAALRRIQQEQPSTDPFVEALERLTEGQIPEKLDPAVAEKVEAYRILRAQGKDSAITVGEAIKKVRAHRSASRKNAKEL